MTCFFTYSYVGLARYAPDARVLATTLRDDPKFHVPQKNKDYLVDSGYANRHGYLVPYRKEFGERTRYLLEPAKKCKIDVMHHYVLLSNTHLEFGRKNGGFLMNFLGMISPWKEV